MAPPYSTMGAAMGFDVAQSAIERPSGDGQLALAIRHSIDLDQRGLRKEAISLACRGGEDAGVPTKARLVERRHLGRRGDVKAAEPRTHALCDVSRESDPPASSFAPAHMHQQIAKHIRPPASSSLRKRESTNERLELDQAGRKQGCRNSCDTCLLLLPCLGLPAMPRRGRG